MRYQLQLFLFACMFGFVINPIFAQTEQELKAALDTYRTAGNNSQVANCLNKLGQIYWSAGDLVEAEQAFDESLQINLQVGNQNAVKTLYLFLGAVNSEQNDYATALSHYENAISILRKTKSKPELASALINKATLLANTWKFEEAAGACNEALSLATELNNLDLMKKCYLNLSEYYKKLGKPDESLKYFNMYSGFQRKHQEAELAKTAKRLEEIKKEADRKATELKKSEQKVVQVKEEQKKTLQELDANKELLLLQEKEQQALLKAKQAQERNARLIYTIAIVGAICLAIIILVLLWSYQVKKGAIKALGQKNDEIQKQNEQISTQHAELQQKSDALENAVYQISEQNLKITDSINYAQHIQKAMLPDRLLLKKLLPDSFVFFRPRDIVSGDFFWFREIKAYPSGKRRYVVTAVDCTGHGVPGAFMSLIAMSFLEEIVNNGTHEASSILNMLNTYIRTALKQDTTDNRDGMDMALCVVDEEQGTVDYSGAKNSLVYVSGGELVEIRANRESIGGYQRKASERIFSQTTLKLEPGMACYMYSDGYIDQFGGGKGRKFLSKNLKALLLDIHQKPMDEQEVVLSETITHWIGERYEQLDDMLIIGFRL